MTEQEGALGHDQLFPLVWDRHDDRLSVESLEGLADS